MEYRKLGSSELEASVIALGAWEFGRDDDFTTGDQEEVNRVVNLALDAGINLFDTAEMYAGGSSEEMLGEALAGRRDEVLIATKVIEFGEWTKDLILERLQGSLKRLRVETIDLYQMHYPKTDLTEQDVEIMMDAFGQILSQGLVRYVGVSNFRKQHLELLAREGLEVLATNQIPLSLLWRVYDVDGTTEFCEEGQIAYLPYSPLAQGFLTGRFSEDDRPVGGPPSGSKWNRPEMYGKTMAMVDVLKSVASECGKTPAQVALSWVINHPAVGSAIVGTRKADHLADNLGALGWTLDPGLSQRLEEASMEFHAQMDPAWQSLWGDG